MTAACTLEAWQDLCGGADELDAAALPQPERIVSRAKSAVASRIRVIARLKAPVDRLGRRVPRPPPHQIPQPLHIED